MAEFKLERFKYIWKGPWVTGTVYNRDDVIRVGGKSYVCLVGHTAETFFDTDLNAILPGSDPAQPQPKWRIMTDGRTFNGTWQTGVRYNDNDIVTKDGSLWICVNGHTSTNFAANKTDWTLLASNSKFTTDWATATDYSNGALVKYNGIVFKCIQPHVSQTFLEDNYVVAPIEITVTVARNFADTANVYLLNGSAQAEITLGRGQSYVFDQSDSSNEFFGGANVLGVIAANPHPLLFSDAADGAWGTGTIYSTGVTYELDGVEVSQINYVANFSDATTRQVKITVAADAPDNIYYYCRYHSGMGAELTTTVTTSVAWEVFLDGIEFAGAWAINTLYRKNDLVLYGGSIWKATSTHTTGSAADTTLDTTKFALELTGLQYESTYSPTTQYQVGDVVRLGGTLYYAKVSNKDDQPGQEADSTDSWTILQEGYNIKGAYDVSNAYQPGDIVERGGQLYLALKTIGLVEADGSSSDYLEDTSWELLVPSKSWSNSWLEDVEYYVGEVVYYYGQSFVCNEYNLSTATNFPGDNGNGFYYWDLLVQSGVESGLTKSGDLLTYDLTRERVGDGSSIGATNVPIGESEQLLSVDNDDGVFWKTWLDAAAQVYVSTDGVDGPNRGETPYKPFKTVRYACEYIEDTYPAKTPAKVKVSTGRYEEIGPISIPAGCVVMGDELRSTTIVANSPIAEYQNEFQFKTEMMNHLDVFILPLMRNETIVVTPGNNEKQVKSGSALTISESNLILTLKADYMNYIEYATLSGDTNPTLVGTNLLTSITARRATANKLEANIDFVAEELLAYARANNPNKVFTDVRIRNDIRSLVRGICYDLRYTGNYKTLLASQRYANAVNGSQLVDLFRVRDITGLRNTTLEGLSGTLNPPGVYDLYQRPTSGAYTALDPGWGPADDRVWINSRSPYLQGNTTIGDSCVGMRVDGLLHNGGNKSMTANDYTQVLSDGIGAWVSDKARVELVSVFTYYNQVGYLAETGGIIRATNGNNSYGTYGAVAQGLDPNEVPLSATVWNRDNDPIVQSVFAGEFSDEIFALQYQNCGENFTTATATITGAGVDASTIFEDFRDGALYESRLVNPEDSGAPGGVGYFVAQRNVAEGNATSFKLAPTDGSSAAQIEGLRVWIVSGVGTGQYGYINSYSGATKIAQVYKESDNTAGWDHIIPGTVIESTLATNSVYRIEPRIKASHPGFTSAGYNMPTGRSITDMTFTDTTFTFTGIAGTPGTGVVQSEDGLVAQNAEFNITKNGTTYAVTIADGGLGYAVGDSIIISGADLGGATPANDCTIKVATTTNDSSNSIATIVVTGTGRSGKFVAIATPNFVLNSDDGTTWSEGTLPNSLAVDWKRVVSGNNRAVAIGFGTNESAYSLDGVTWTQSFMPSNELWSDITFGEGKFVAIAENTNTVAYSTDGATWSSAAIPDDVIGDSTASQWQAITYGKGIFVAIAGNDRAVATSTNGVTWTRLVNALPAVDAAGYNFVSLAYGANRFLALENTGETVFSFDGTTWQAATDAPSPDGSTTMKWYSMKYADGVFFAICDANLQLVGGDLNGNNTSFCATTEDGITWTGRDFTSAFTWRGIAHGTVSGVSYWVAAAFQQAASGMMRVQTGCRAKVRADLSGTGTFNNIVILDPGSGYSLLNPPVFTLTDNSHTVAIGWENRVSNGVLAQPSWVNRGVGYKTSSTRVTVTGDGFADIIPDTNIIKLSGMTAIPGPGTQILFANILDDNTLDPNDLKRYRAAIITDLGDDGTGSGTNLVQIQISPRIKNEDDLVHGTVATLNQNFSQCRISGHDFLDIGTGNFTETNYPTLYAGGAYFTSAPENEVYETQGGRVFYVSTDQDGNFRAGELFSVQQSTGIVTISAEFFDLDGLSELALGGVRLGGSGAVVREFSTDPTFAEDSNNVVPTQRAIASFLADRLSVGGSDLELNAVIAGQVFLGGDNNVISNTVDGTIQVPVDVDFSGQDAFGNLTQIQGSWVQQMLFHRNFDSNTN
jgi:hypothetical protein